MMRLDDVEHEIEEGIDTLRGVARGLYPDSKLRIELAVAMNHLLRCVPDDATRRRDRILRFNAPLPAGKSVPFRIGYVHVSLSGLVVRGEMPAEWHREVSVAMSHLRHALSLSAQVKKVCFGHEQAQ